MGTPFADAPVSCIVIGAGDRGWAYARYAEAHPERLRIAGVAEPDSDRRNRFAAHFQLESARVFSTWQEALSEAPPVDSLFITTPDQLHTAPALAGLERGYHILLEKPMATDLESCEQLLQAGGRSDRIVAVAHVLRYAQLYRDLHDIVSSGRLGEVVSIEHIEPVGYWHMAHSFVRGNWRSAVTSSPMILAKCCHDLDLLQWLAGTPCEALASFGSLQHFRRENAPDGSTARCTDGCAVEAECPYSALKLYMDMTKTGWPVSTISDDLSREGRTRALEQGPYGRCVYRCDNDVVDHQVVAMSFTGGLTASLTMSAFTTGHRRTRVMGTLGEAIAEHRRIDVHDFRTGATETHTTNFDDVASYTHGGGDWGLLDQFVAAVQQSDPARIATSLQASFASHRMAILAEQSRVEGRVMRL